MATFKLTHNLNPQVIMRAVSTQVGSVVRGVLTQAQDSFADAQMFVQFTKLNLPGKPVRLNGTPGNSPGGQDEPVLHRDSALLASSIRADLNEAKVEAFIQGIEQTIATGTQQGPRQVSIFLRVKNYTKTDESGRTVRTHDYADNHEQGKNIPARPYMGPAYVRIEQDMAAYINARAGSVQVV